MQTRFRDLKKNQYAFCKELEHWKVDYPRIKDKNKDSKTETNLAQVISIQSGSTSQADRSYSDSTVFSFSFTNSTIGYSSESEWILDTGATCHVCPNRI